MKDCFPKVILITGATGSIGSALARAYAAPGYTLILQGRNQSLLDALAMSCRQAGAEVHTAAFDVTDIECLQEWGRVTDAQSPVDLAICNAGINSNIGPDKEGESWQAVAQIIDVNIRSTMALIHALLPGMRQRRRGQIAIVSSLAAWHGLPVTPAYCASKAALKAYGEALRGWLAPEGVRVNVIMPGYVDSPMCRAMPGPKPFLWTADRAARVIRRGLAADRPRISFPFPLNLGCWLLAVLPASSAQRILKWLDYDG